MNGRTRRKGFGSEVNQGEKMVLGQIYSKGMDGSYPPRVSATHRTTPWVFTISRLSGEDPKNTHATSSTNRKGSIKYRIRRLTSLNKEKGVNRGRGTRHEPVLHTQVIDKHLLHPLALNWPKFRNSKPKNFISSGRCQAGHLSVTNGTEHTCVNGPVTPLVFLLIMTGTRLRGCQSPLQVSCHSVKCRSRTISPTHYCDFYSNQYKTVQPTVDLQGRCGVLEKRVPQDSWWVSLTLVTANKNFFIFGFNPSDSFGVRKPLPEQPFTLDYIHRCTTPI